MIVERYLIRETALTFVGVSVLLLLMFLSGTFIRILADAAEGDYPIAIVLSLFGLKAVGNIVFILPLAFFLAILLAFGRLYRDSEMIAMNACGVGPQRVLRAVAALSVILAVFLGFLALWFAPWSEEKSQQLLDEAGSSTEIEGIVAGRFNQTGVNDQLFYVEAVDREHKRLRNVFVHGREDGKLVILSAGSAYQEVDKSTGDRFLVLLNGHAYHGTPGAADFKVVEFEKHGVRLRERETVPSERPRHAVSSIRLLASGDPSDLAELHWRLAVPVSTVLLALLAVPLSKASPRQGRYGKLFAGIMIYIVYNNLLTMGRAWLGKGEIPAFLGLWWVHGALLVLVIIIFARQTRLRGPRPRKRPVTA